MLDLAAGLPRPGLPGVELSWCDGHDRYSGEAEAARRNDAATTARRSGGSGRGGEGPPWRVVGSNASAATRLNSTTNSPPSTPPVRHMSGSSGLSGGGGGLSPGAHVPGFTRSPLRGWVKRAAIAPKGRQRRAWGVSPRMRSHPRSKAPKGRQQDYFLRRIVAMSCLSSVRFAAATIGSTCSGRRKPTMAPFTAGFAEGPGHRDRPGVVSWRAATSRSRSTSSRCGVQEEGGAPPPRASDWTSTTTPRCRLSRAPPRRASPSSSWLPSQPSPSWDPYHGSAR